MSGQSSTGLPSTLHVTGALVNFGGTGNQVIINNAIAPTGSFTSNGFAIPVSATAGGTITGGLMVAGNGTSGAAVEAGDEVIAVLGVALHSAASGAKVTVGAQAAVSYNGCRAAAIEYPCTRWHR